MLKPVITASVLAMALGTSAFAEGDAKKGKRIFNKCKACHAVGEDAKNKVGPTLNGIVGKAAGENPDFKYSDALLAAAAEGLVWDEENITGVSCQTQGISRRHQDGLCRSAKGAGNTGCDRVSNDF